MRNNVKGGVGRLCSVGDLGLVEPGSKKCRRVCDQLSGDLPESINSGALQLYI